jgi:hypothetical protein
MNGPSSAVTCSKSCASRSRRVFHTNNLAGFLADRLGTRSQGQGKRGYGHGREQQPPRAARGRMHKGVEVAPLIAVLHHRLGPLATETPQPAQDRFEPHAMLVGGP